MKIVCKCNLFPQKLELVAASEMRNHQRQPGETSLVRGHARLYKQLRHSGKRFMIIGEDDIAVVDTLGMHLDHVIKNLPNEFDCVKLELQKPKLL